MKNKSSLDKVSGLLKETSVYKTVLKQLNKDFSLCGFPEYQFEKLNPQELVEELASFIQNNFKTNPEKIRLLFYRIDIKEEDLLFIFNDSKTDAELCSSLTLLLLNRQIEKVINRSKYS